MFPLREQLVLQLSAVIAVESRVDRTRLGAALQRYGCECQLAADAEALTLAMESDPPTVVVIDASFGGRAANRWRISGRPLCGLAKVVVRAERTVDSLLQAVHLLRRGASGVITAVDDPRELEAVLGWEPMNEASTDADTEGLTPLQQHERQLIIDALRRTNGHVIAAAHLLQLGQATVYRKIHKYRIPRPRREAAETVV